MKTYYVAENYYSTETSVGFANTWYVVAYQNKKDRDNRVKTSPYLATKAIKAADINMYCSKSDIKKYSEKN